MSFESRDTSVDPKTKYVMAGICDLLVTGQIDKKDVRDVLLRDLEKKVGYQIETLISESDTQVEYNFITSFGGSPRGRIRVRMTNSSTRVVLQTLH